MKLIGASTAPRVVGAKELPGKANYFIGNDSRKWRYERADLRRCDVQLRLSGRRSGLLR